MVKGTPTHNSYRSMIARCKYPCTNGWKNYGGRGIKVCDRWIESYNHFVQDMGLRPPGMELGRINNDGDYSKDNCEWQTRKKNGRNRRNNHFVMFKGILMPMSEAIENSGLNKSSVEALIRRGFNGDLSNVKFIPQKKLTVEDVLEIRKSTMAERPLARKFKVSRALIRSVKSRLSWKSLP